MFEYTVRLAVEEDLDAVAVLFDQYRQFYGKPADLAAARAFLEARSKNRESTVLVAATAGGLVGFAQVYPLFSSVSLAPVLLLNDLYVAEAFRRKGLAEALLSAVVKLGRERGVARLSLSTEVTNTTAQALYAKAGWVRDERFFHYNYLP